MADIQVTQFIHINHDSTANEDDLQAVLSSFKQADGSKRVLYGRQLENPDVTVLVVVWATLAAATSFASPAGLDALGSATSHVTLLSPAARAAAALSAPTTEVFTGYGAQPGSFEGAVRAFAARVDEEWPAGYLGSCAGPVEGAVAGRAEGAGPGLAVKLVIGWESREAHDVAKGKAGGAIQENVQMIRVGRQEGEMWHVHLKEL